MSTSCLALCHLLSFKLLHHYNSTTPLPAATTSPSPLHRRIKVPTSAVQEAGTRLPASAPKPSLATSSRQSRQGRTDNGINKSPNATQDPNTHHPSADFSLLAAADFTGGSLGAGGGWDMNDPMPSEGTSLDMNYPMFKLLHGNWSASASLGAMRALVGKLDMLLLVRSQGFSSKRVKDGIRLLKDDVEELSSYLDELSEVEDPPPIATCWMNEVRDLSYDMEDYIDSLLFMPPGRLNCNKHNKKHKKRKKNKKLITSHVKIPKRLKWCKRITYVSQVSEHGNTRSVCRNIHVMIIARPLPKRPKNIVLPEMISRFKTYIQDAIERHDRYLHCCSTLRRRRFLSTSCMVPTPPYDEAAEIVIDSRMSEFINSQSLAVNEVADQQHLKVVSILGPGCLGKTTLARVLYNRIGMQFDCRAFIRVSKKPDMKRLFCDLFSQLHQKKEPLPANCDELGSSDNISKHLQSKRYLIVIDDLWDASVWNIIKYAFPEDKHGSRIIITTQIEDVAIACCCDHPEQVFEMKPLDNDHSRKLFFNRLFGSESDCPAEFKQVSNEIVDICGGLPLATINIASQLANQPTAVSMDLLAYTNDLLRSYLWSNSTSERTRRVLNLSYNNLPHYLKTCLLYLSMYSAGSIICKDDLVKQWVAEGFIPTREWNVEDQDMMEEAAGMYFDEQDQYMMEKAAGMYFDELIDRRFIQPFHINYNNKVLSCTVHDMVRDLIAQKCAEDDFIVAVDYNRKNIALSHKVRRLSLVFGDAKYAKTPSNIIKSQVRSLRFFGLFDCMPCIREFKILRVLNLQLSNHLGDHDPIDLTGISDLYQLRYLKIAGDVCIKLPNHMRGLKCLETLDVTDITRLTDVPWDIIYLPHLLHLSLPVGTDRLDWIGSMSDSVISQWSIGKLNYLQDLHLTSSSTHPSYHMERSMEALRSLIGGHYNLKTVIVAHSSSAKKTLVHGASKVIITWDDLKPPPLLQRFEFTLHSCCMFSQIPPWVEKHGNLCILKIPVRLLDMAYVDILGGLRALTDLSLYVETAPIDKIIFSEEEGFSILKYFKLRFLTGIACLKFETDAMPSLLKLKLVFNAIPPMGQPLFFRYGQVRKVKHQRGTAVVDIEHMPSLNEVSVKFGGATADLEYASRTFVCNHPRNPRINTQLVDYSSYGDASTKQKQPYDIPEEKYWNLEKDSDGISEEEPDRIVVEKQAEPSKGKKRKNKMNIYDNKLQRLAGPADKRISMSREETSLTLSVGELTQITGGGDEGRGHMFFDKVLTPGDVGIVEKDLSLDASSVSTDTGQAYLQQQESSRSKLAHLEQELQRARQQGMFIAGGGDHSSGVALAFDLEYARWLDDHQRHINNLRVAVMAFMTDLGLGSLVESVMLHYDDLFKLKSLATKSDVFHVLSGMWMSPAERFFMWLGGFRSSEILKVLASQLGPLTDEQLMAIWNLQQTSEQAEEALSQGMEALQQALAETLVVPPAAGAGPPGGTDSVTNYMGQMAVAMGKLGTLENFLRQGDLLWQQTLQHLRQILTTRQAAGALLVVSDYFSRLRALSSLWLAHLEQELQRARQQGMFIAGEGDHSSGVALAFDLEYARWLDDHQRHINNLRVAVMANMTDLGLGSLVESVMLHYDDLFRLKSLATKSDVFHVLSGMWMSPAERFFMWLGGFRSSEILKVLASQLGPLTDGQRMAICNMQQSSQQAEDTLSQGMEALQQALAETLAVPPAAGADSVTNYMGQMAVAMGKLGTLENFLRQGDLLRQQTLQHLRRILTTRQAARALLAVSDYFSRLRALSSLWVARPRD